MFLKNSNSRDEVGSTFVSFELFVFLKKLIQQSRVRLHIRMSFELFVFLKSSYSRDEVGSTFVFSVLSVCDKTDDNPKSQSYDGIF